MKYITMKDYERCISLAKKEVETIPVSHCRKREECYNRVLIDLIKNCKPRKNGTARFILVDEGKNLGTSKYSKWIRVCNKVNMPSCRVETEKTYCYYRKTNVLAFVK